MSSLYLGARGPAHQELAVDPRRLLGAYYTPDALAKALAKWALAPRSGTVLDPSFGGCAFLKAATEVLASKGIPKPGEMVFGVDVDPSCVGYVRESEELREKNCLFQDFMALSPNDLGGAPFQAVIGNPPFVRHHWLRGRTWDACRAAVDAAGIPLPAMASSWAYFLVHSLSFLAKGGRLAMLVPEAILQADYAKVVRDVLEARFSDVCLVYIRNRLFHRTDEAVVVVAASGYGRPGRLRVAAVEGPGDLTAVLNASNAGQPSTRSTPLSLSGRPVDPAAARILTEAEQLSSVKRLGDFATVRVGLVTGANSHFIRDAENLRRIGVPQSAWTQVVSRTRWLSGLEFTEGDHQELVDSGQRAILVRPTSAHENDPGILQWVTQGTESGVLNRFKCTVRRPWFRVSLPRVPDAFATCTRMGAPLVVLNRAGCQCTNTLHAVYWRDETNVSPAAAAVGFLTSVVSVWAELHGKRYGGGVLKMEPGVLKEAPVPLVHGAEDALEEISGLVRLERECEARALADELVLKCGLGLSQEDVLTLQRARSQLMSHRRPSRDRNDSG